MSYAQVAVNSPLARRRTFSYTVPSHISLAVGQAVWVPFGSKILQGIVFQLTQHPSVEETREIIDVIDPQPLLSPVQIKMASWLSEYYLSPIFEAAALMLPPGFKRGLITFIELGAKSADGVELSHDEELVLDMLRDGKRAKMRMVEEKLGKRKGRLVVEKLCHLDLVSKSWELEGARVKPKIVYHLSLLVEAEVARQEAELMLRKAPRQASLLQLLAQEEPISLAEAKMRSGCSMRAIATLKKKGLISTAEVRVQREPLSRDAFPPSTPPKLTSAQDKACAEIEAGLKQAAARKAQVYLLHGVTGSGKTEVYLNALGQTVKGGKRGIVLVPEIALTPQTIERFAYRFPGKVAVLHSKLSLGEQFDEWQQIREGAFDVVIGPRGVIFAPQPDLGLIVVDEEHEWAYKQQEQSPRYHAREVALKLAELSGAVVILGSATPDVESFYQAQKGKYRLLQLPERVAPKAGSRLPEVEVVDMRRELKTGNRSIFSRSLAKAMSRALDGGEQVILFLNRRGAATFIQCRNCGFVLRCNRCDVPLTYHSAEDELVCHQCNRRTKVPDSCPGCGRPGIRFLGIGTQRVMEEAKRAFPKARLLRWDKDTTGRKHSHEEILGIFRSHRADILIGTQMIAKGLDLPMVTLVGIISADTVLHLPDPRAAERTFQLLSQVGGRAGRGEWGGKVIIQTYTPDHYAIISASKHDYAAFYEREMGYRRQLGNPPFNRLASLTYSHTNPNRCQRETERVFHLLEEMREEKGTGDISLLGPTPAYIGRVRGRFRWQIVVRGNEPSLFLRDVALPSGWVMDIDPASLI